MNRFAQEITFTVVTSATGSTWGREVASKTISISDNLINIILAILLVLLTWYREWLFGLGEVVSFVKGGYYGVAQTIREYSLNSCPAVAVIG